MIDTRPAEEFAKGHVAGTFNIPLSGSFVTWAGWLIPSDRTSTSSPIASTEVRRALGLIGLDRIAGVFPPAAAAGSEQVTQVSADELKKRLPSNGQVVVDVRNDNEWNEGHIADAIHIPLGQLAERVNELPASDNIVVHCQGGSRSSIAASLLQKLGRKNVTNLTGGYRSGLKFKVQN